MINIIMYLSAGLLAGVMSGLLGIAGGVILIPIFVMLFGLSQHTAQGTTLALLVPPVGLLAALTYYKAGFVDLKIAAFVCIGLFFGALFGAKFAVAMPQLLLRRLFGIVLLIISVKMILGR